MRKEADVSKKSMEENELSFLEAEEKFTDELFLTKRILNKANKNLKEAIAKKDTLGIQVASELIESAEGKLQKTEELRKTQEMGCHGKKRKTTIESKESKELVSSTDDLPTRKKILHAKKQNIK